MDLRGQSSNPGAPTKSLVKRVLRAPRGRSDGLQPSARSDSRGAIRIKVNETPTRLRPERVAQLLADRDAGFTLKHLASKYGIARQTVIDHCKRAGRARQVRPLDADEAREAARLYESGLSLVEVGKRFGVGRGAVKTAVLAHGGSIRGYASARTSVDVGGHRHDERRCSDHPNAATLPAPHSSEDAAMP